MNMCNKRFILLLILVFTLSGISSAQAVAEGKSVDKINLNEKTGRKKVKYPILSKAKKPEEAGFSAGKLRQVDKLIENEVDQGFPGAVLVIIKDGKIVKNKAYGYAKKYDGFTILSHPQKMTPDAMFDLASNTKMFSVNYALQHLVSEGEIDPNQTIQHYLPEFQEQPDEAIKGKNQLRIVDLLHHVAGFPSSIHYYNPDKSGDLYSQDSPRILEKIIKTPLQHEPGTVQIYSDIDYMLLGYIIEKVTEQPLNQYVENNIYKPLGLTHTLYNPLKKGFKKDQFAATELHGNTRDGAITFPKIRTYTLQGEVHDEKAFYSMGGVSGHAGLFSNSSDIAVLLQVMLNGGGYGHIKLFDRETIDLFTTASKLNPTYGLGWRLNGNESMNSMFGEYAGKSVIGHTGWTGTITVIDRENNLAIALLTNKKHSPVLNPLMDSSEFQGDVYSISTYGKVISTIYKAIK